MRTFWPFLTIFVSTGYGEVLKPLSISPGKAWSLETEGVKENRLQFLLTALLASPALSVLVLFMEFLCLVSKLSNLFTFQALHY